MGGSNVRTGVEDADDVPDKAADERIASTGTALLECVDGSSFCRLSRRTSVAHSHSRLATAASALPPDLHFVAADGSRHAAHRFMLCAWSPHFRERLQDSSPAEVTLSDVQPEILSAALAWMRNGEVHLMPDGSLKLACDAARLKPDQWTRPPLDYARPPSIGWLQLLELACRWEIHELRDQICAAETIILQDVNLVVAWEAARHLGLDDLHESCQTELLRCAAASVASDNVELPRILQKLSATQFRRLLASDDLTIPREEHAFWLACAYLKTGGICKDVDDPERSLTYEDANHVLSAVRWRLLPKEFLARDVMLNPVVCGLERFGLSIGSSLLRLLSDALQFQVLISEVGSMQAASLMPEIPTGCFEVVRPRRRYAAGTGFDDAKRALWIGSELRYEMLKVGMKVLVEKSLPKLRKLCNETAPGAEREVKWDPRLKDIRGKPSTVRDLNDEARAVQLDDQWWVPYTALSLL